MDVTPLWLEATQYTILYHNSQV